MQARHHLTRCSWTSVHLYITPLLFVSSLYHTLLPLKTLRKSTIHHEKLHAAKLPYYNQKTNGHEKADSVLKGENFMSTKFKAFLKDTSIRAVKTMAQTALSLFTIGQAITDISWTSLISISLVSGLYSILTSIVNYNIRLDSPDTPDTTE